ncbi:geranylgeranyl diphosphate reductase, chloroplastic-like [Primulina tabacum]|uniref:geranylgeranyl diphosphate reductase, chloroplastic-like n=1 Tax=Primulina tabacum TaxID=48773 RepID=UPI003F5A4FFD
MVVFDQTTREHESRITESVSPHPSSDMDLVLEEIQDIQNHMSQMMDDIKKIQNTQLAHSLKLDSSVEFNSERLKKIQVALTSISLTIEELRQNRGLVESLSLTQDSISKRVDFVETSVSRKIDLMQTTVLNAILNVFTTVGLLSVDVRSYQRVFVKPQRRTKTAIINATLRAAVIGGGPAGSSAAEALAAGGIETFLFERSPEAAKPCGGAIPFCMLDEFSIPSNFIHRKVTQMKIVSPSNVTVDFGKTLKPNVFISMLRRKVLDSFLRNRAVDCGATLVKALVTNIDMQASEKSPYQIHYISNNNKNTLAVDVIIGADGANGKVVKSIKAGDYTCAIAFQERIKLPEDKMRYYENLAEMSSVFYTSKRSGNSKIASQIFANLE